MIQNVDLMDIATKVAEYVKTNYAINDFITEHFGVDVLTVYIGDMLHAQIPRVENTPYIVFYDWKKREGLDVEFCSYECKVAIGVGCGAREEFVETENGALVLDAYDVSCKFAQLVIDVINSRNDKQRPLSSVEMLAPVAIDADGGHWGTILECKWRIYQTMGFNQEEF